MTARYLLAEPRDTSREVQFLYKKEVDHYWKRFAIKFIREDKSSVWQISDSRNYPAVTLSYIIRVYEWHFLTDEELWVELL